MGGCVRGWGGATKNESLTISCMSLLLLKGKNKSFMRGQIHLVGSHIQIICIGNVKDGRRDRRTDRQIEGGRERERGVGVQ